MQNALTAYLPKLLLEWYAQSDGSQPHRQSRLEGYLLFADASGFTQLTRALGEQGREGPEILTAFLNSMFTKLDAVVCRWEGDILKFAGDAIWCYLPAEVDLRRCVGQMFHQINVLNRTEKVCKRHPISLHAGVSFGSFDLISVGRAESRLETEMVGEPVLQAYTAAELAKAQQLYAHESVWRHQPAAGEATPTAEFGLYPVRIASLGAQPEFITTHPLEVDAGVKFIRSYVPEIIDNRLSATGARSSLASEYRRVTVLFVSLTGGERAFSDASRDRSIMETLIGQVFDSALKTGATIARVDPLGESHKILLLYGALQKEQDGNLSALQAAQEISRLGSEEAQVRIGLASGRLFCGEVGSPSRKEFTVIGDAVNLAARLMSRCEPGAVLVGPDFADAVRHVCDLREKKLSLKGLGESFSAFEVAAVGAMKSELVAPDDFVGRVVELETLRKLWEQSRKGRSHICEISGSAGIGKTAACAAFVAQLPSSDYTYVSASGSRLHRPGLVVRKLLEQLLSARSPAEDRPTAPDEIWSRLAVDPKWAPLLAELIGEESEANDWTRGLSPALRSDKSAELLSRAISELLTAPHVVILDNLEQTDSFTHSVLYNLRAEALRSGLLLLVSSAAPKQSADSAAVSLEIPPFSSAEMDDWLQRRLHPGAREKELAALLKSKSGGSVLYLKQTIDALIRDGTLEHLSSPTLFEVSRPLQELMLPDKLEDLELSLIDRLPETQRELVKVASVFGEAFHSRELHTLLPSVDSAEIEAALNALQDNRVLAKTADGGHRFHHNQTRDAVYGCLPVATRRRIHQEIGELLARSVEPDAAALASYHLSRGDDPAGCFAESLKCAEHAFERSMLVETVEYLERCSRCIEDDTAKALPLLKQYRYFKLAYSSSALAGDYAAAYRTVRRWRALARRHTDLEQYARAANEFARLLWKQSRFERLRAVFPALLALRGKIAAAVTAESYAILAEFKRRLGNFREAIEAARFALEEASREGDRRLAAEANNVLGLAQWGAGDLQAAQSAFELSVANVGGSLGKSAEARAWNNSALIADESGDFVKAERLLQQALAIFNEIGDRRNAAFVSGNLANLLGYFGKYRQAIALFESADRVFCRLGEEHPHFYTVGNLADLKLILGDSAGALEGYRHALEFAERSGDSELLAECTVRQAEHEFYYGDAAVAVDKYEQGIALARQIGSKEYEMRGILGLGRLSVGTRDADQAARLSAQLAELGAASQSQRIVFESRFLTGETARLREEIETAITHYRACLAYAASQHQFELGLKSALRLYEHSSESKGYGAQVANQLLSDFAEANGEDYLQRIRCSGYFRFFTRTIDAVLNLHRGEPYHQSVG